ncbi:MAG: hypothetical protein Q7U37_12220 [Gallionella sp.]|nr:hypothetical protein [Gallionella sp.]MDP1594450.1 hypothetical protein [Gallionella sp.]MDP1940558.1 hypothetical protein [Gallionella sp.]
MGIVTMNMSSYEFERNDAATYGDEVLCAGWNPALALRSQVECRNTMPPDMLAMNARGFMERMFDIEVDAEVFLQKMYTCQ